MARQDEAGGRAGEVVTAALALLRGHRPQADRLVAHLVQARLRELMADAIVASVRLDQLPDQPRSRVATLARRYRQALLSHRDGALVVAGTFAPEPGTLDFAEALINALLEAGVSDRTVADLVDSDFTSRFEFGLELILRDV